MMTYRRGASLPALTISPNMLALENRKLQHTSMVQRINCWMTERMNEWMNECTHSLCVCLCVCVCELRYYDCAHQRELNTQVHQPSINNRSTERESQCLTLTPPGSSSLQYFRFRYEFKFSFLALFKVRRKSKKNKKKNGENKRF